MDNDDVIVGVFSSKIDVEIKADLLRSNGINVFISTDDAGGMYPAPFQPTSSGTRLFVKKADVDRAKKILGR